MSTIFYKSPSVYKLLIRVLYRSSYDERYTSVVDLIPENSIVIDVCCGDCQLYKVISKTNKKIDYLGLDSSLDFIKYANKKNIPAKLFNLDSDVLPTADVVVMMGSLYQFIPKERQLIEKLLKSAEKLLIISEPHKNVAQSSSLIIQKLAQFFTKTKHNDCERRLNKNQLSLLYTELGFTRQFQYKRDMILVFDKNKSM